MEMESSASVPPGFRFHPTEEELVGYYLNRKINSLKIDLDVIVEIDLYRMEPWDIQERSCKLGYEEQKEWYFFSHKDRKYPTGTRTNRATAAGFWKATGRDKAILSKNKIIGMRKTLVFYRGRAPNGSKTDWIMHEYRLHTSQQPPHQLEEGWVVCRAFKKPTPNQRQGGGGGWVVLGRENGTTFNGWSNTTTTTTPRQMDCYPLIQSSTIMQSSLTCSSGQEEDHHHHQHRHLHLENQLIIELPQVGVADSPTLSAKGASSTTDDQCSRGQYAAVDWKIFDDMFGSQQLLLQADHEPPSFNAYSNSCFSFISQEYHHHHHHHHHQIVHNNDTIAHDHHTSSHLFTGLPD